MKIACIGWGSLIWDPRELRLFTEWLGDGPALPIEFARHSSGDRVTLVLVPGSPAAQTLWALLDAPSIGAARKMLRAREGTTNSYIGAWRPRVKTRDEVSRLIGEWAAERQLDGVVWTCLPPKWNESEGTVPTCDEVLEFLGERGIGSKAEEYVRRVPRQVRTQYRASIEASLAWTPLPPGIGLAQGESGASSSTFAEDPRPVNELIRSALVARLAEINSLLGADRLHRESLERDDLRTLALRLDRTLDALTGVSTRDRALVALERAVQIFGEGLKGEVYEPGAELTFSLQSFGEFSAAVSRQFPQFPEEMLKVKYLGPCMVAYARALRPGRPRSGSRAVPEKWVALRNLAMSLMGPDFGHMEPEEFRRTVLRARRKLREIK